MHLVLVSFTLSLCMFVFLSSRRPLLLELASHNSRVRHNVQVTEIGLVSESWPVEVWPSIGYDSSAVQLNFRSTTCKMSRRHSQFRPCIDLHSGVVKQIVGGTLDLDSAAAGPKENFVAE